MSASSWPGRVLAAMGAECVAFERPQHEALRVRGPDRAAWLNGLLTSNVSQVKPGTAGWGLALTKQGKIQSELFLVAAADELLLFTPPGQSQALLETLDRFLIMEDAELEAASDQRLVILVGPQASAVAAGSGAAWGELDLLGFGGALLAVPEQEYPAQLAALKQQVSVGDAATWSELRVERGLPEWGVDYGAESNPHEAALAHRVQGVGPVDWNKGCYLGQEVVCMQDMRGKVRRSLFPLVISGDQPLDRSTPVLAEQSGEALGELRSSGLSQALGGQAGFAYLKTAAAAQPLVIDGRSVQLLAQP